MSNAAYIIVKCVVRGESSTELTFPILLKITFDLVVDLVVRPEALRCSHHHHLHSSHLSTILTIAQTFVMVIVNHSLLHSVRNLIQVRVNVYIAVFIYNLYFPNPISYFFIFIWVHFYIEHLYNEIATVNLWPYLLRSCLCRHYHPSLALSNMNVTQVILPFLKQIYIKLACSTSSHMPLCMVAVKYSSVQSSAH